MAKWTFICLTWELGQSVRFNVYYFVVHRGIPYFQGLGAVGAEGA